MLLLQRSYKLGSVSRTGSRSRTRLAPAKANAGGPEDNPAMQEAMKRAMTDPQFQQRMKDMQTAMNRPEVQKELQQMQAFMANPQLQQRMQSLRSDPEFEPFFQEIQKGGMMALMKFYNDPVFLQKLSAKIGDVAETAASSVGMATPTAAAPTPAMAAPAAPEITNLIDAARYGDIEAVEDFLAIGKDPGMSDKEGRTPLHWAAAMERVDIARMLLDGGAPLEAKDSMQNTPLHYAAGYGRGDMVRLLLELGADKKAKNHKGSTPHDLATADARNPISQDKKLVAQLK